MPPSRRRPLRRCRVSAHKHTPGPWRYEGAEVWATAPIRFNLTIAGTPMIATLCKHEDAEGGFPVEANARLIAAAPELLEALSSLLPHVEHHESCCDHDAYNNAEVQTCGCGLDAAVECAHAAIAKAMGEPA